MTDRPLTVAWLSFFPLEWLPDPPAALRGLPRRHPAPWLRVLAQELQRETSLTLHIFSVWSRYPRGFSFRKCNAVFHCVKVPRGMRTLSLFWWETVLIRRALRAIKPDLVHAWGIERGAALVASRLPYRHLVSMQGLLQWCQEHVSLDAVTAFEARLEPISLRRASTVTAESRFAVDWLRHHYPHLDLHQVEHAPTWLFHEIKRKPELAPIQFLFVGTLCELKGADLLLLALDQLRDELDFRLTMVGGETPGYMQHLRSITSGALWDRIAIRSNLSQGEVADEMARAAIMLFPTRVDNSPNSVKEAVVAGLPVVASAIGGIPDYVAPELNGLTFEPGNMAQFIKAIRAAVAHPLFSKGTVDADTLRGVRDYLSPRVMAEKFMKAYRHVIQNVVAS